MSEEAPLPMRVAVLGAGGRMGLTLLRAVAADARFALAGAVLREGSPRLGEDAGVLTGKLRTGIALVDDLSTAAQSADAILDFTTPSTSVAAAVLAAERGLVLVTGTTGFSAADEEAIAAAAAAGARIVKSGNMSLGLNLLAALVEQAAEALGPDTFDIEILEMHHRHKVDAPSGAALLLGAAAAKGRGVDLASVAVKGRDGHTGPRPGGAIGFASLRGGSVVGEHDAIFAGEGERVVLSHRAEDRSIFARGGLEAALWARGRPAGLYSMRDVLGLSGE